MALPLLERFKSEMADGGARASLFTMSVTYPALTTDLTFFCRVSEIPGSQQSSIIQKFAGREIKFTGQRTFTNLTVTVLNDEAFKVRRGLDAWMNLINDTITNTSAFNQLGLEGVGTVTQYAKTGADIAAYKFIGMFPVNIAPIPLDWSNDAAIEEYTVEFAYQYWL
jgi:hypothetical protein